MKKYIKMITDLCDYNSFQILNTYNDEIVIGICKINGISICIFSQNGDVNKGCVSEENGKLLSEIIDYAMNNNLPLIQIINSSGAKIQDGILSLNSCAEYLNKLSFAKDKILIISIVIGYCVGAMSYGVGFSDFTFTIQDKTKMFITSPKIIKSVTYENVSDEELGGSITHNEKSMVSDFNCLSENNAFDKVKKLLTLLQNRHSDFKYTKNAKEIKNIVPTNSRKTYNNKNLLINIFDDDSFLEMNENYAKNIIVGFAKLNGNLFGIISNNTEFLCGALDYKASKKISNFLMICNKLNINVITFVDCVGFLPSKKEEENGIILEGAKLLYNFSHLKSKKISVILRKAIGGSYITLSSKVFNSIVLTCKDCDISVMGDIQKRIIIKDKEMKYLNLKDVNLIDKIISISNIRKELIKYI